MSEKSEKNMIEVLIVEPEKEPRLEKISDDLKSMQAIVGGWIEPSHPFMDEVVIVCNEFGKVNELPYNRVIISDYSGEVEDIIRGTFFIAYSPEDAENFQSLPKDLADKYMEKFKYPELFFETETTIRVDTLNPNLFKNTRSDEAR